MRSLSLKNIISLFFVFSFLLIRVADLHAFSHFSDDDGTDCELCELIITHNQFTPFSNHDVENFDYKLFIVCYKETTNSNYSALNSCITLPKTVYNKPPPSC